MEITKHDMDLMKGFTKEVADHIRDIETIENSGLLSHDSPLYKYKEAIVGLFEKEVTQHTLASKLGTTTASSQVLQGEISR